MKQLSALGLPNPLKQLKQPSNPFAARAKPASRAAPVEERFDSVGASLALLRKPNDEASKVLRARLRALLARLGVGGDDGEDSMEERFAAALYIEVHDFEAALSFCAPGDTELQEAIRVAQATSEFEKGEYVRSAILYARTRLPIEQVASKFHQAQLFLPLKHYLYAQLFFLCAQCAARRRLPSSAHRKRVRLRVPRGDMVDRADDLASNVQMTLLCAWLTQLYVALLSAATDPSGANSSVGVGGGSSGGSSNVGEGGSAAALENELRAFLADQQRNGNLDAATTYTLLGGAGSAHRSRLQLHFATLCADWPRVVALHLEKSETQVYASPPSPLDTWPATRRSPTRPSCCAARHHISRVCTRVASWLIPVATSDSSPPRADGRHPIPAWPSRGRAEYPDWTTHDRTRTIARARTHHGPILSPSPWPPLPRVPLARPHHRQPSPSSRQRSSTTPPSHAFSRATARHCSPLTRPPQSTSSSQHAPPWMPPSYSPR